MNLIKNIFLIIFLIFSIIISAQSHDSSKENGIGDCNPQGSKTVKLAVARYSRAIESRLAKTLSLCFPNHTLKDKSLARFVAELAFIDIKIERLFEIGNKKFGPQFEASLKTAADYLKLISQVYQAKYSDARKYQNGKIEEADNKATVIHKEIYEDGGSVEISLELVRINKAWYNTFPSARQVERLREAQKNIIPFIDLLWKAVDQSNDLSDFNKDIKVPLQNFINYLDKKNK